MVVPRSAYLIDSDSEYTLYAVTVFKKHAQEFVHKSRERKWVPRDFKAQEGGKEGEMKELHKTETQEKKVWGETLRLCRTGWSESVMSLIHVLVLRMFVETVLRYGLPLDYVGAVIKVCRKLSRIASVILTQALTDRSKEIREGPQRYGLGLLISRWECFRSGFERQSAEGGQRGRPGCRWWRGRRRLQRVRLL